MAVPWPQEKGLVTLRPQADSSGLRLLLLTCWDYKQKNLPDLT
jgi:hypothetical protein